MSRWQDISPGLVNLIRLLASPDPLTPLPDGTVTWFNRDVPFIGPDTQVGIYLRVTSAVPLASKPGKERVYNATTKTVQNNIQCQNKITLQVQAKSLESTDTTWCLTWLTNITDRLWDEATLQALLTLNLAPIDVGPIVQLEEVQDDHMASYGTVDLHLTYGSSVLGLPLGIIEHVTGMVTADAP